jgi:Response regulators consisting of a CheY-like receiver domain and a winged-helix DNA-binding domain
MNISQNKITILLIEDNPGDVRLTQEAFKEGKKNVNLDVVMDGVEAINYLYKRGQYSEKESPDLILLDLNLPKMDGREVLEKVKNDDNLRMIPIIVLTTSDADQDILKSYNLHVNCYLNKPVDFDKFFDIIQKIEDFWLTTAILPSMLP